ncbi:MAG: hypothetical protein MJ187_04740 [Alphaproteobacteria bacterium]|nr:hypothetical protein [Alphaproteobacteria bacterium]
MLKNKKIIDSLIIVLLVIIQSVSDYATTNAWLTNRWYTLLFCITWMGYGYFLCWVYFKRKQNNKK